MVELASAFDPDDNDVSGGMTHYLDHKKTWIELRLVTTKDMQLKFITDLLRVTKSLIKGSLLERSIISEYTKAWYKCSVSLR